MDTLQEKTQELMALLGQEEAPFGLYYTATKPEGFGPQKGQPFSREREAAGEIDWIEAFENFTCFIGSVWLARKKKTAAWMSHEACGCMGGGFYCGMYAPYVEHIVNYVSVGVPGTPFTGERYFPTPESMRAFLADCAPECGRGKYCVLKPLDQFTETETPLSVTFFVRPEVLTGLHSLTGYTTGDHTAVVSPFGAACASIVAWPLVYAGRGLERAVIGGFDLSARKFLQTDELTFSVPFPLYRKMLDALGESALPRETWTTVRKKVMKSNRMWGGGRDKTSA